MSLEVQSQWDYDHLVDLTSGMDISKRPELLDKSQLVNAQNVFFEDGRIYSDTGYKDFLGTVRGVPRAHFQFFKTTGSSEDMLITDDTVYTETNDAWQYVHDGDAVTSAPTLTSAAVATATSVVVSSITGFSDGDNIGISLDDGTQHQTTVNGAPAGSTISFDDALPSGAAIGKAVVKAVDLNGVAADQVSIAVMTAFNYMIFTNGQNTVKYYDGSTVRTIPNLPSSGNTICKAVAIYNNMLLLIHTIEGGTAYPQRIRNCDVADITNWTTGIAGSQDLYDSEDFLITAVPLGPYMMLYKERTIIRMEYIGDTETPRIFNFDDVVTGEGARSVDSVVDIGTEHIIVGNSNIYSYKGGFDLEPKGDKVWSKLFGNGAELNPNLSTRISLMYVEERDEVWLFYPDSSATDHPNNIAKLKLLNNAWSFRSLPIEIAGYGFYQTNTALKWSELVGSWLAQTFKWGGGETQAGSPTTIFLSATGSNQAYEYDYVSADDDGNSISWEIETKELYNPQNKFRTNFLDLRGRGGSILIEYSLDGGINWDTWVSTTLAADFEEYRYHKQVIGNRIRFRISGTSSGFSLAWLGLQFRPESLH